MPLQSNDGGENGKYFGRRTHANTTNPNSGKTRPLAYGTASDTRAETSRNSLKPRSTAIAMTDPFTAMLSNKNDNPTTIRNTQARTI